LNYYPLTLSANGVILIKQFEQFVPHYYIDKVGRATIGYGSTQYKDGSKPKPGDTITEQAATDLLIWAAGTMASAVSHAIRNPLNQNQQDSTISFIYNEGVTRFMESSLLKQINTDPTNFIAIRADFMKYNKGHVNGVLVVINDLTFRRGREADVFCTAA
jgi:lysozyme